MSIDYLSDPEIKEAFKEEINKIQHDIEELLEAIHLKEDGTFVLPEDLPRKLHTAKGTFMGVHLEREGELSHVIEDVVKKAAEKKISEDLFGKIKNLLKEYNSLLRMASLSPEDPELEELASKLLKEAESIAMSLDGASQSQTRGQARDRRFLPEEVKTALLQGRDVIKITLLLKNKRGEKLKIPRVEAESIAARFSAVSHSGTYRGESKEDEISLYIIDPEGRLLEKIIKEVEEHYRRFEVEVEVIKENIKASLEELLTPEKEKPKIVPKIHIEPSLTDELMLQIDSIRILYSRYFRATLSGNGEDITHFASKMEKHIKELEELLIKIRFETLKEAFKGFEKLAEDLASKRGKKVRFLIENPDVLIDKVMVEKLTEPILHLIKNAIDHGIEPPEERRKKGKDEVGTVCFRGEVMGNWLKIIVEDDGRGIDWKKVGEKAESMGLLPKGKHTLDILKKVIFSPGFTTREQVDHFSGRGIGLDTVKAVVEEAGGFIDVESVPGRTSFIMGIPYEIFLLEVIEVITGKNNKMYVPIGNVIEVLDESKVKFESPTEITLVHQNRRLPLIRTHSGGDQDSEEKLIIILNDGEGDIFALSAKKVCQIQRRMFRKIDYKSLRTPMLLG